MRSQHDDDDITPPLGTFADPAVQRAFAAVFRRIESTREQVMVEVEKIQETNAEWFREFRDKNHAFGNQLQIISSRVVEHVAQDDGLHRMIQDKMASLERSMGKIEAHVEKGASASQGWWKWALGTVLAIVTTVVAAWIALTNEMTSVKTDQSYTREKMRDVDSTLEKLEQKIETLTDKVQSRGGSP